MRQDMRLERRRVPPRQIQAAHRARNVWSARRNQDIPHSVDSSRTSAPLTVVHAILSEYSAPRCGKHLPNPPNNACRPTLLAQPLTWARLFQLVLMPPACALMTVASSAADADVGPLIMAQPSHNSLISTLLATRKAQNRKGQTYERSTPLVHLGRR